MLEVGLHLCFNTSHVVIYQMHTSYIDSNFPSFNTSHVVIYPPYTSVGVIRLLSFNTSHVVIYRTLQTKSGYCWVSIHLMLLFIPHGIKHTLSAPFVSIHLMLLFILVRATFTVALLLCFNTSHVVIYPNIQLSAILRVQFQYISYCYLSTIRSRR